MNMQLSLCHGENSTTTHLSTYLTILDVKNIKQMIVKEASPGNHYLWLDPFP